MLKITKELRDWLVADRKTAEDATEDEFRTDAGKAFAEGALTPEKYLELTKDEKVDEANGFAKKLDRMADGLADLTKVLTEQKEKTEESKGEKKIDLGGNERHDDLEDISKMISENGGTPTEFDEAKVRVKSVKEAFSTIKTAAVYPMRTTKGTPHLFAGEPVVHHGRALDVPSDFDKALAGAWAKFQLASVTPRIAGNADLAWRALPEIDKRLLHHLCAEGMWDATEDHGKPRMEKGYHGGTKQLIDDVISGGFEAAPIVFDDLVIETPLLYGELWPLVNEIPLARGRRVEGVWIGTVTGGWGGVDATNIGLFGTAGYVAAFDTTIYRWQGAVLIGLDFMSDTPIDFGATITRQYGERLLEDLDDVVATGNGLTQPQGIMNAAGTTAVAFGGVTTLGAYETLEFSVHKRELKNPQNDRTYVFCGTDTSYSRARGLNVTAADQRRLGGGEANQGDYRSYRWMGRPFKINESLANTQLFAAVLARYRAYRRKGFTVRTSTEGATLIRANEMLITVMARYGGQLERGACAGVCTTAPA